MGPYLVGWAFRPNMGGRAYLGPSQRPSLGHQRLNREIKERREKRKEEKTLPYRKMPPSWLGSDM